MPGRWDRRQEMDWLDRKAREQSAREQIRAQLTPDNVSHTRTLMMDFPWLSPGVAAGLARAGLDSTHPVAQQIAQLEFQQKKDWTEPGDTIHG